MKQNLYIPGDLVIYKPDNLVYEVRESCPYEYDYNYRSNEEHEGRYKLMTRTEVYTVLTWEKYITPIPITSSILKKNGWKKSQIYFTNSQIPRVKLCTDEREGKWSVSINGDIMGGYIYYVHQLQHILFAFKLNNDMEV